jgi:aspartate/methionine/tyrosine aminotransferase
VNDGFPAFDYLRYAKSHFGGARFSLTASGVADAAPADLLPPGAPAATTSSAALGPALELWRERVSARYGVPPGHAFPALGTSGAVFLALTALSSKLPRGAAIAIEHPAYGVFESCARLCGREIVRVERRAADGWRVDLDGVERAFRGGARVLCVTDLHNPTGAALPSGDVEHLRRLAERHGAWVLVDEVYRDFLPGAVGTAYRPGGRVVATSSLTKCYGLGGLRAGFVFAPPEIVGRIEEVEEIAYGMPPSGGVLLAAQALGAAEALLARGRAFAAAGRPVMDEWMSATPGVSWVPPAAGISGLVRVDGVADSVRFAARLREELDVQVVPGAFFGAEGHVRVSFGLPPKALAAALCVLGMGLGALRE